MRLLEMHGRRCSAIGTYAEYLMTPQIKQSHSVN